MRPHKDPIAKFFNVFVIFIKSNFINVSKNFALPVLYWRNKSKNENSFFDTYFNIIIQHTHIPSHVFL